MKTFFLLTLFFCMNALQTFAVVDTLEHCGYLTVQSENEHVSVYCDTAFLGTAPLVRIPVETGTRVFRFTRSEGKRWYSTAIAETIVVRDGEEIARQIKFPLVRHITSVPDGASVMVGDSVIGSTPMFLESSSLEGMITVLREGYESATLPVHDDVHVVLIRHEIGSGFEISPYLVSDEGNNHTSLYLTAGATVLTGAAAAFFKIQADSYYSDYRRTGNSSDLDNVRKYDLYSGISLAASQISLFILAYHLLSQ